MTIKKTILSSLFVGSMAVSGAALAAETQFISIGTGGVTGVYYPAGGSICRMLNKGRKEHGIRCSVESTGGSGYNVNSIRAGELEFGVAQSDVQADALSGKGQFNNNPYPKLRSVFSLHPEPIHMMARADSGISSLDDFVGKRVNIGNPGSGNRSMMEMLMKEKGWTKDNFAFAAELKSSEMAQAICDDKFDVTIFVAGLPNGSAQEATTTCDIKLIPMTDSASMSVIEKNGAYSQAIIPGGMYAGNPNDVPTFGPKATIVTSTDVSDEVVYRLTKSVFENLESFKRLHPAFARLQPVEMVHTSLVAPLHPGAEKYYREADLMK
ncbi:TAXI family TRAP transporter solute-binding subunit [Marinomonas mediterranea]|uniref:TRAP transporter solute receptor, TAXI family n=1 Tax=Marinomonas mediterranea (strain ATCC 700492 / JCM 21426 / NBRC 103028 / MMB-1) TaxID=717774 RepID=F2JVL8_MARM1|nr:TAXI family TRAP transporter solute-binding subunit [Marinomonas mediterranea]ADZ90562.1 TRAP transporter solute receptor, TAXI family [Marinomonas mediterranea MMB-1]WCN16737.1 TAXI family TRAP transporter solute-binding subunit [Marinomonas mediterranea MMB-1]